MLGVCCTCQETHPVRPFNEKFPDFEDGHDLEEHEFYIMATHDPSFAAGQCEGTGTMPQAVFRE